MTWDDDRNISCILWLWTANRKTNFCILISGLEINEPIFTTLSCCNFLELFLICYFTTLRERSELGLFVKNYNFLVQLTSNIWIYEKNKWQTLKKYILPLRKETILAISISANFPNFLGMLNPLRTTKKWCKWGSPHLIKVCSKKTLSPWLRGRR